jgi:hypothetical protein
LSDVAFSGFETTALSASVPAAIADGAAAKLTKSPAAKIMADRALALTVMSNLLLAAALSREETPARVHSSAKRGNLLTTTGKSWAIVQQRACSTVSGPSRWEGRAGCEAPQSML